MVKLPISAFIVCKDEAHLLENCIKSVLFCDEIIVINLESTDNTIEIAEFYGAIVKTIPTIPILEMIHEKYIHITKNKWVLITDPDEVTTQELAISFQIYFNNISSFTNIGVVDAPIIYYFKNRALKGTSWGGVKYRTYLIHKDRFTFSPNVHAGRSLNDGFERYHIKHDKKNHIIHYWMQDYLQLFEKHKRYLKSEGISRFNLGHKTSIETIIKMPFQQFTRSFISSRGFRDGFTGFFLSVFRAWYFTSAHLELYKHQRKSEKYIS